MSAIVNKSTFFERVFYKKQSIYQVKHLVLAFGFVPSTNLMLLKSN